MSELEALAKQGRENETRSPEPSRKPEARKPPELDGDERRRMRRAVIEATPLGSETAVVMGALGSAAVGIVAGFVAGLETKYAMMLGGVCLVFVGLHIGVVRPLLFRLETRWMEGRPYRLDAGHYVGQLAEGRRKTALTIALGFERPIPEESRELLRDAGRGVHPDARAELDGDDAMVLSTQVNTYVHRKAGSQYSHLDEYDNHEVHRFVRTALRKGVAAIHASHPVADVSIRLEEAG